MRAPALIAFGALLVLGASGGCGRLGFSAEERSNDAALDAPDDVPPDGVVVTAKRQRNIGYDGQLTTSVALPQPVLAGSALVVFSLAQEQPVMSISDSLGQSWQVAGVSVSTMTGSKVNAWFVCGAKPGLETVSVTQSFNNGPIHVAVYEITGAAQTNCIDVQGQNVVTAATIDQKVTTAGSLARDGEIVLAGFGAWFDTVSYVSQTGDEVVATARPTGPTPEGDTLATTVSTRNAGPQMVYLLADHATLYAAYLVSVR